jgi:hypothetical protein
LIGKTISKIKIGSEEGLNELYLTFDIDWAHDEIITDTIELVEAHESSATWFITHKTTLLERLRSNIDFELGIHPNFNFLLDGDNRAGKDAAEVVDRLLAFLPEAKCVRSHSLTQSSKLSELFRFKGLTHECNTLIPAISEITLKPWTSFCGLTRVPYFWEDDVHILYESIGIPQQNIVELATTEKKKGGGGLKVFDFHPIHVFLNTESLDRYERTRPLHHNPKELIKHRYEGYGTRNRLIELLELSKKI